MVAFGCSVGDDVKDGSAVGGAVVVDAVGEGGFVGEAVRDGEAVSWLFGMFTLRITLWVLW